MYVCMYICIGVIKLFAFIVTHSFVLNMERGFADKLSESSFKKCFFQPQPKPKPETKLQSKLFVFV